MIVPMKKVSLIIPGDKKAKTLKKLRKLGLVHVEITEGKGEKLTALREKVELLERGIFAVKEKGKKKIEEIPISVEEAEKIAEEIALLGEEKKAIEGERIALNAEISRLQNWGEVDLAEIEYLREKGVNLDLYEIPAKEYKKIGEGITTLAIGNVKSTVKCIVLDVTEEGEDTLTSLVGYKVALPTLSTGEMKERVATIDSRIKEINGTLSSYSGYVGSMKEAIAVCEKDVEFETYFTGMAEENLSDDGDVTVSYFCGYIEAQEVDGLKNVARENAWGLLVEDPTPDDNVPTKLQNNKFVSLIYPLTDFLGTVPGYFEHDISAWFLGFILIFFGIIFGDGGYGLFISALAIAPMIMSLVKKKPIQPALYLLLLFGLSTMLWGALTCTWFGLTPDQLPQWLKSISIPVISNVNADRIWYPPWTNGEVGLTTAQNLQIFCFSLALVQLTVAHIKGAIRNRKSLKVLGDIGSIFQLVGIYYVVLSLVVNSQVFSLGLVLGGFPVGIVAIALVGVGFVMSFVFSNYEGSIAKSVKTSLTNIVSVLLGVVNVFSDIVSYIRLWAVGLAGAAISATVNELAGPLLGNFLFMIVAIFLLIFGHGLNMILNILSVIVHGIRLNTLEFSSHLDMSWSGHKFKPFEE